MSGNPRDAFIDASVWHGTLESARAILAAHPEIGSSDIHTAAILGDDRAVKRFLAADAANAIAKGGPRGWDALTHLCFSKFLRLDRKRSAGFVRAAKALLDAGASANTGFYEKDHQPEPEFESVLYGAAGVAHHANLTRLLVERGADRIDADQRRLLLGGRRRGGQQGADECQNPKRESEHGGIRCGGVPCSVRMSLCQARANPLVRSTASWSNSRPVGD